ncbi:MAG: hypothetical protein HOV71_04120 [Hamadaea sp.]|nr:hypothetical protein [Hamadaea sp.]
MKKRFTSIAAIFVAIFALSVWGAPAALADSQDTFIGCGLLKLSACGHGGVTSSNTQAYACDDYDDGYGFYTRWWLANGSSGTVDDPNGNDSGKVCGWATPGSSSNRIVGYQVCSKKGLCNPRINV